MMGTKKKTKKVKTNESESVPLPVGKQINPKVFQHLMEVRKESYATRVKVVTLFRNNVEDYFSGDQQFIIKFLWKTRAQINQELESLRFNYWKIRDSENCVLAKLAVLLRASRAAERYDDVHRAYCKENYQEVATTSYIEVPKCTKVLCLKILLQG